MALPALFLKKSEERRALAGHPWIYSNEVDAVRSPLAAFEAGAAVRVLAHDERLVGAGYVNPHALICARLLGPQPESVLSPALLETRLREALALRDALFERPFYRLVYGESDRLPGLIVDRYGDVLVAQLTTAGMERARGLVVDALDALLRPRALVLRNDTASRDLEGLPQYVETPIGNPPGLVDLEENGARFQCSPLSGQKTGWFWDHRLNRARLAAYARGRRVLDLFSYTGAWGVQAALSGASAVLCVDASAAALAAADAHAALNGVGDRVATRRGDVLKLGKELARDGQCFDLVILDPPAFIKRRKDAGAGLEAYQRLNSLAMQLLRPPGVLISASCSYHLTREAMLRVLGQAARRSGVVARILEQGHQAPDHPVHPLLPETDYLKTYTLYVTRP